MYTTTDGIMFTDFRVRCLIGASLPTKPLCYEATQLLREGLHAGVLSRSDLWELANTAIWYGLPAARTMLNRLKRDGATPEPVDPKVEACVERADRIGCELGALMRRYEAPEHDPEAVAALQRAGQEIIPGLSLDQAVECARWAHYGTPDEFRGYAAQMYREGRVRPPRPAPVVQAADSTPIAAVVPPAKPGKRTGKLGTSTVEQMLLI